MLKQYHHIVGGVFRVVDACVIGAAWLISYWIRFYIPLIEVTKGFPLFNTYAALTPLIVVLWMTVFSTMNLYASHRMLRRTHEVQLLLKAHGVALLFFIAITYLFSEYKYSRVVMLYFGILSAFFLVFFRLSLRNLLRALRQHGFNLRYMVVVGEGEAVEILIQRIEKFPELGVRCLGVILHPTSLVRTMGGKAILGRFQEIGSIIHRTKVDQVVIALPRSQYHELDHLLESLKDEPVDIQLIPDIHEYVTLGCEIEDFDGLPIVRLNNSPLNGWGGVAKRITDMIIAFTLLVLLSPLLLVMSILIKLSSFGPIFYRQERMGLDGQPFQMLKFRSMKTDSEKTTGAVWAKPNDERRTVFGVFLRMTSLDELPQLWNVLKGEMSLVGPRPERPIFVQQFRKEIPHYMLRHKVKAGITGWAQIHGWRGNTSLNHRIECDLYYIRNWSYLLDLKILIFTLWKGLMNKNAY